MYSDSIRKTQAVWRHFSVRLSPCLSGFFAASDKGDYECILSLFKIFNLCQVSSPLLGFFRFVPGFVKGDQGIQGNSTNSLCKMF